MSTCSLEKRKMFDLKKQQITEVYFLFKLGEIGEIGDCCSKEHFYYCFPLKILFVKGHRHNLYSKI